MVFSVADITLRTIGESVLYIVLYIVYWILLLDIVE